MHPQQKESQRDQLAREATFHDKSQSKVSARPSKVDLCLYIGKYPTMELIVHTRFPWL